MVEKVEITKADVGELKVDPAGDLHIVEATGSASAAGSAGPSGAAIEKAMADAGLKAMEEGITDPDVIRERKLVARKAIKEGGAPVTHAVGASK